MMAGKGDTSTARQPTATAQAFDGGIATTDVEPVWQTEALPGWVVHHLIPLLTAGQSWPKGSESQLWQLRVEYVKLMNLLIGTLDPTAATLQSLNGSLQSPAKPAIFKRLAKLYDDQVGVVAKAQESFGYAKMADDFARETQYSKLSINVAFWVSVIAAFIALIAAGIFPLASLILRSVGVAGATRIALIMERLALVAARSAPVTRGGQVTRLAGAGAGAGARIPQAAWGRAMMAQLATEIPEEILEELFLDMTAQYQQIKMGTRDTMDWKKVQAAAIGAGTGAVVGTVLGGPMSRFTNNLPGISRLNRVAGDDRGVGNAFLRFPGRALNTGLNNMLASPAGSIVANYVVYDQFALPGADGLYGAFLGGAGRTNTISPFNPSVAAAIFNPVSSLSGVFDAAMAAQHGGPGPTGGPGAGPTAGDPSTGPRPGSPDGGLPTAVPPQRQTADPTGSSPATTRRDVTSTLTDPAGQPTRRGTQAVPTPDIVTADTNQAAQQGDDAQAQQDLPTPQQEEETDAQGRPQAQDTSSSGQRSTSTTDPAPTGPADPTGVPNPTNTPETTTSETTAPQTTAPETTGVPDPTAASGPAAAPAPAPDTAPATAPAPDATPERVTVTTGATGPADARPAASPAPAQPAANGDPAAGLVTRLIGAGRQARDAYALVTGRPIEGTRFVANGRVTNVPPLTVAEARTAVETEVLAADLGATVTGLRWTGPGTLVVELDGRPDQTFTFEVGPVPRGRLGRTVLLANNVNRVRLAPRVAPDQVARLVLHEIVDTLHARTEPRQSLVRRLLALRSDRDECLTARQREEVFLTRRIAEAGAAQRPVLEAERDAVRRILRARGRWTPPPVQVTPPPSTADLLTRLRAHDQAVEPAMRDLGQALAAQIDRLSQMEAYLRAVMVIGTGLGPTLTVAAQARAAYEAAQLLLPTADSSATPVTEFARALHQAHQLHLRYERQVSMLTPVPALPETAPGPDLLRRHIAALRTAADELTDPARNSFGTATDRQAAAASAGRAAEVYQALLDRMDQARGAPLAQSLVSQSLQLGATYEQHYRQLAEQEQAASARGARAVNTMHAALLKQVSGRQDAALSLAAVVTMFGEVVNAQGRVVRAYNEAANRALVLEADALARQNLTAARAWRSTATELNQVSALQAGAERLAVAARDAHQELADLLDRPAAGDPVDHGRLNARTDAAITALRTYQETIARLPPGTPPVLPAPPRTPPTALARVRRDVDARAETLASAQRHSAELALKHQRDAATARENARDAWNKAALLSQDRDDGASARMRKAEADAEAQVSLVEYHTQAAAKYEATAAAAQHALQAVEPVLAALNEVNRPDRPLTPRVESALEELRNRTTAYDSTYKAVLPPARSRTGHHLAGPIADLPVLTRMINDMLEERGVAARYSEEELRGSIRQDFRSVVSEDGMILRLPLATGAELLIRLTLDDLKEVANPGSSHSQTMIGQLRQGGGSTSGTNQLSRGVTFDKDLMDFFRWGLRVWPGEVAQLMATFGVLRVSAGWGDGSSVSTTAEETGLAGSVEDNSGMAAMWNARARWDVELRTPSGESVTRSLTADDTADDTAERQNVWVAHSYLIDRPSSLIQLPEADRRRGPFPHHTVTGLTGLTALVRRVADQIEAGPGTIEYHQIVTMITKELPAFLGEAINDPSGFSRSITVDGQVKAKVTVRTTVAPGGVPVGVAAPHHGQEELRVGLSVAAQSHSERHNKSGTVEAGLTLNPEGPAGIAPDGDLAPQATAGWGPARAGSASTSVSAVGIRPGVQKYTARTAAFGLGMVHTVTIQTFDMPPFTFVSDPGTGLFRLAETDAYRYGLPVDAAAAIGSHPDGTVILRDDPVQDAPPGREGVAPTWVGTDPGQTRTVGIAAYQKVTGMDSIRAGIEEYLRNEGVLPELVNGVAVHSPIPWVRQSQLTNEQLVAEQFSKARLETGFALAAEAEGLIFTLLHHRAGLAAERYTLRIKVDQDFGSAVYKGMTDAEPVTNLDIGSDTNSVSHVLGKSWKVPAQIGTKFRNDPGFDLGSVGVSGNFGKGGQRTQTLGSTVNQVKLIQGNGPSAVLHVRHAARVDRLTGPNLVETVVAEQDGDAQVLLPADLLPLKPPADGHPRPESPRHPTSRRALRLATIAHLDVGAIASAAANLFAEPLHRDSPQFQHLATFFNVHNLVAHPEVLTSGHRTGVDTQTAIGRTRHEPVSLRLVPGESRFLAASDLVTGDINLTLSSHSSSSQRSVSGGAGVSAGVPLPGTPASEGNAGGSRSTSATHERKVIAGPERLGIGTGKQYVFAMDVTPELTVGSGTDVRTAKPHDGTVLYLLAERDALDLYASGAENLPLHQVADAAERLMNGNLKLSRRVAIRFMDRYLQDLAEAMANRPPGTAGLPHVPGVPLTAGHTEHRALAALLDLFPEGRLTELMPPGAPPRRRGEPVAETRERMLSKPEFYPQVLDGLRVIAQQLQNGEVRAELAPTYRDSIGMSTVKEVTLHPDGRPDVEVDLLNQIMSAVDEVEPGALDRDTALWRALTGDFSGDSWLGKIDNMLDPDSPASDYIVRVDGAADTLEVTVRAELSDEVAYQGDVFDYGQILQLYSMLEENVSESVSLTGSAGVRGSEGTQSAGAATDRGQSSSGASNMQQTRVQRVSAFKDAEPEVRQGIRLSVEVRKITGDRARPSRPSVASRELSGTIDRIIPAGMVSSPGAVPEPAPAVPDPRPIPVPENFITESTRARGLAKAIQPRLEAALGRKLTPTESKTLARLLSGNFRNALFERMTATDGHLVIALPKANGQLVRVHVGAVLSEPVVIAEGHADTEIGQVDRRQWTTRAGAGRTQLRPAGVSGGINEGANSLLPFASLVGIGAGYLDQAGDGSAVSGGNRDETSVFEKADAGSVRYRVDYDVRFEVWPDPDTDLAPSHVILHPRVATGSADVIVFDSVQRALEEQAESPRAVARAGARPVQNVSGPPRSLARLHARPDVHDHRGAADALSSQRGPVNLDADLPAPPYGQLRQAQLVSRELNADVQITIHPPYGPPLTYIATPDGRLHAQGDDGAFGQRFAGLPTALIAAAEQHGIDLHALHERTRTDQDTSLAEQLRRELSRRAVPLPAAPTPSWPVSATPDDAGWTGGGTHQSGVTHGSPIPGTAFVADGRTEVDDLTVAEARSSFLREMRLDDFGGAITEIVWAPDGQLVVVHETMGELHFTVRVDLVEDAGPGEPTVGYLGETTVRGVTGTSEDPHVMTLTPRVAGDQVARLVLHEISDVLQRRAEGEHAHAPGRPTRDECLTARRNELRFLRRKWRWFQIAGDTASAEKLEPEIAAVERDILARTPPPRSIDELINRPGPVDFATLGIVGEPQLVGRTRPR